MTDRDIILGRLPFGERGAEIGAWRGDFSSRLLSVASELHLIDPWVYTTEYGNRLYGGAYARNQADMDDIYRGVCERFWDKPVVIHRLLSSVAAGNFPDKFFGWVYIDGNHYYDFVLSDLELYYPKVQIGGLLCGDDYYWTSVELGGDMPVKRAVSGFVSRHGLGMEVIGSQYLIKCSRQP
jgi:hypothetical protein